ncbi:MAG TPA: BadF/BadG/BcrA/BcrD ATPase family protein, partial [Thermomicrobiales bacterium]|nr:BadF/BadG/BcrA/BcrD ATPase family protein [Thermomicrobiales bacterium]
MTRQLFAGIDGGGTKTVVVMVDANGREVSRAQSGTSNPAVIGHEPAVAVLVDVVETARRGAGDDARIVAAWFGLSGCDRPEDQ